MLKMKFTFREEKNIYIKIMQRIYEYQNIAFFIH